jgi:hypothetical protein
LPCCCDSLAGDTSVANGSQETDVIAFVTPSVFYPLLSEIAEMRLLYSVFCVALTTRIIMPRPLNQLVVLFFLVVVWARRANREMGYTADNKVQQLL